MKSSVHEEVWRSAQTGHYQTWVGYAQKKVRDSAERHATWKSILAAVEREAPIADGERVLDIGGGLDTVLDFLPRTRRYALDPLAARLAPLGLGRDTHNTSGVFEDMPFRDRSFDRVFLMNVLDHVRSPQRGLAEIARVLRPGGWLVLSVDTFSGRKYLEKRMHKWWERVRRASTKHPWVFSVEEVQRLLQRSGFRPSPGSHVPGTKQRRTFFTARRA